MFIIFQNISLNRCLRVPLSSVNEYKGLPLINGRGFKILVDSKEKADKLFAELKEQGYKPGSEFFNRWLQFEAYRKIVFRDSIY